MPMRRFERMLLILILAAILLLTILRAVIFSAIDKKGM